MTAPTYEPEVCARLVAEAREDDGPMLAAFREFGDSYLIRTKHGAYGTHAVVAVLERSHAMAEQLAAAQARIAEHEQAAEQDWKMLSEVEEDREAWRRGYQQLQRDLEAAQREVTRLRIQLDNATVYCVG